MEGIMSRRRKGTKDSSQIKVGCTGRSTHPAYVFETVQVWEDEARFVVTHGVGSQEKHVDRELIDVVGTLMTPGEAPRMPHFTYTYRCPVCGLTKPMDSLRDGQIYAPLAVAKVPMLDLSALGATLL